MTEQYEPPMTVKELADYLRLDRMAIYKMLKEGTIPASRIGHQWRFFRKDIDDWIRSKRVQDLYTCENGHESTEERLVHDDSVAEGEQGISCRVCESEVFVIRRGISGEATS